MCGTCSMRAVRCAVPVAYKGIGKDKETSNVQVFRKKMTDGPLTFEEVHHVE